jgi:hypothetical protein
VPIRAQSDYVRPLGDIHVEGPVVGEVITVLRPYNRISVNIGWRRPGLVHVREWAPEVRALRRGDRCLVWVRGLQDVLGKQVPLASFHPPVSMRVGLQLPVAYLRRHVATDPPSVVTAVTDAESASFGPSGSSLMEPSLSLITPSNADATAPAFFAGPASPAVVTLEEELAFGAEFADAMGGVGGLGAVRLRAGLAGARLRPDGVCVLEGPPEGVLAGVRWLARALSRWAWRFNDLLTLAGVGLLYVSAPVELPWVARCEKTPFTAPFGHPFHWLEVRDEGGGA